MNAVACSVSRWPIKKVGISFVTGGAGYSGGLLAALGNERVEKGNAHGVEAVGVPSKRFDRTGGRPARPEDYYRF